MLNFSTGYRNAAANAALSAAPASPLMNGCVLMLYAGTEPAGADSALGGATLLATYSVNNAGTPLAWSAASGGSASKVPGAVWSATGVATGTAAFFRYQLPADAGAASTTAVRIQGKAGLVSDETADLALSSLAIVNGAPLTIDAASATVPASL